MFRASLGMVLACLLFASRAVSEPADSNGLSEAGTPTMQTDDVVRAQALLAEFRAARPDGYWEVAQSATNQTHIARTRVEIDRDIVKLDRSAVPLLIETLDDPDPQVSAVVALALGRIGDKRAVPTLLKVVGDFNNAVDTRHAAAQALGRIADPASLAAIQQVAKEYPEVSTRRALLQACTKAAGQPVATPLD
jgi:HEAT repeat protein